MIFREGRTKGIGRITKIISPEEEIGNVQKGGKKSKKERKEEAENSKSEVVEEGNKPPARREWVPKSSLASSNDSLQSSTEVLKRPTGKTR